MKNISELTNEDSETLASILKYDIPDAEGVKDELIECYNQDIEGLMLGKYLPIKLFFTGLNWLCNQGYDLSELIKNLGIDTILSTPPQLREGEVEDGWVKVEDSPLFIKTKLGWECTEAGDKPFIAAVPYNDNKRPTEKNLWWIMPCVVEDGKGLCIIGDEDNEEAGWQLEDVTHYKPLDLTPPKSVLPNPPKQ